MEEGAGQELGQAVNARLDIKTGWRVRSHAYWRESGKRRGDLKGARKKLCSRGAAMPFDAVSYFFQKRH
jgi:hypothetical protein